MGMKHGKILVRSISNDLNPTTQAPSAGPNGELGRLALENDLNTLELQVNTNTTNISSNTVQITQNTADIAALSGGGTVDVSAAADDIWTFLVRCG